MPFSVCVLSSGSKGNAIYVKAEGCSLLIDAGLSAKQLVLRMEAAGLPPGDIKAIVLTHEHGDHTRGMRVLARRLGVPVLATPATWEATRDRKHVEHRPFQAGKAFSLEGLTLQPFTISHDAADPVALVVEAGGRRLGVATDMGQATALVRHRLTGCHCLVLESNHDPEMLAEGPYPEWLKQRVRGRHGHLSNQQSGELLSGLCHSGLANVVLAHLSETNNHPALARAAARQALDDQGCRARLAVASQDNVTPLVVI